MQGFESDGQGVAGSASYDVCQGTVSISSLRIMLKIMLGRFMGENGAGPSR
jgi:hypothetical protein